MNSASKGLIPKRTCVIFSSSDSSDCEEENVSLKSKSINNVQFQNDEKAYTYNNLDNVCTNNCAPNVQMNFKDESEIIDLSLSLSERLRIRLKNSTQNVHPCDAVKPRVRETVSLSDEKTPLCAIKKPLINTYSLDIDAGKFHPLPSVTGNGDHKSEVNESMLPQSTPQRRFKPVVLLSDDEESDDSLICVKKPPQVDGASLAKRIPASDVPCKTYSFLKSLSPSVPEAMADADALNYRKNFKRLKESLARKLYELYNEKVFENKLPSPDCLVWNGRLLNTAGYCSYSSKTCKISLSSKVLSSADRLRDTLLHEMCHAAVAVIDKKKDAHGPIWKSYAVKCKLAFPEVPLPQRCHSYSINYRYQYGCSNCSVTFGRHKVLDVSEYCCKRCKGKFKLLNTNVVM